MKTSAILVFVILLLAGAGGTWNALHPSKTGQMMELTSDGSREDRFHEFAANHSIKDGQLMQLTGDGVIGVGDFHPVATNHGISEIGIGNTGCFGSCPSYTFIVKSDGTFRYKGFEYVKRKGEFSGTISTEYFHRFAQFIKDSGYMELDDGYDAHVTDNPTTYTMVVMNGKRKSVRNYASAGPIKLWAIERLFDDLMANATWDGTQKTPEKEKP